jgi:murein L,D-transpeptidase YcbB/YkuD
MTTAAATRAILVCTLVIGGAFAMPGAGADDREALQLRVEQVTTVPDFEVDGAPIAATVLIGELYQRRGFAPAWSPERVRALHDLVLTSSEHGLNPADYHLTQLAERLQTAAADSTLGRADTEILCTDALARLVVNLRFGKLDPADLEPSWNFSRAISAADPVLVFNELLEAEDLPGTVDRLAPQLDFYRWLRGALAGYRAILADGGWPGVPAGPTLEPGDDDPRVAALRARLLVTGDLSRPSATAGTLFDDELRAGVVRFQRRHGVDADGRVGPKTIAELNVPVEARIAQIRASLERVRWVFRDIGEDFILVDIAGYHAYLVRRGRLAWSTRIQVGKPYHETPVFKAEMRYLVLNPTWTVPPGILRNETLPAIRKDPGYLQANRMTVVAGDGTEIDPSAVDWTTAGNGSFPYMIRQEPGPNNALGQVKFMFPNEHMVYLHDTPSKRIFDRAERAASHGCIRVENPITLAELLLEDDPTWTRARLDQVLAGGMTTTVNLPRPLTVMLLYWTAEANAEGTVHFRRDLYGRDARLLEHLDEPYRASPPQGAGEALRRP